MNDRLEDFIRDNRSGFDLHEPNQNLWEGIEKKITGKKVFIWRTIISRAAVIAVVFGLSIVAQKFWLNDQKDFAQKRVEKGVEIPELKEAEAYYKGLINTKLNEVAPLLSKYPSLEVELHTDLNALDSIYNCLKIDLNDNVANQDVIGAMIQNYRLRIGILEDMLTFLGSDNNSGSIKKTNYEL